MIHFTPSPIYEFCFCLNLERHDDHSLGKRRASRMSKPGWQRLECQELSLLLPSSDPMSFAILNFVSLFIDLVLTITLVKEAERFDKQHNVFLEPR